MPETKHFSTGPLELKAEGEPGQFRATFATLNAIDREGDVTIPGAFEDGQPVKIAAWSHNWGSLPVGAGTIHADNKRAWVDGRFFLDTEAGREHYLTIKNLGALQEWSYGFEIKEWSQGEFEDRDVRFLRKLDVFEVSPVMLAAGVGTRTDMVKALGDDARKDAKNPFEIVERNGEFCVINSETRRTMGCHPTRAEAVNHLRALMANVEDAGKLSDRAVTKADFDALDDDEKIGLYYELLETGELESGSEKATWTAAFINNLPDSAFATIVGGGKKDSEGKTTPRSLRKLPHHGDGGGLDEPHLRNALSREPQTDMPPANHAEAKRHLAGHARRAGVGEFAHDDHDEKVRRFGPQRIARIRSVIDELTAMLDEVEQAADDAAAADAGKADDPVVRIPPNFRERGEHLVAECVSYITAIKLMGPDEFSESKEWAVSLARRLSEARVELDGLIRKSELMGTAHPRELRRQFERLAAWYGPTVVGG